MGQNLTLIPIADWETEDGEGWQDFTRLCLERDYPLFLPIGELEPRGKHDVVLPNGYQELPYVWAEDFDIACDKSSTANDWNRAALAFLEELPGNTPIALLWT